MDDLGESARITHILQCWGKTGLEGDPNIFHPALFHMLDVACVAEVLLQPPSTLRFRKVIADALNTESVQLVRWLPSLIALHDIGKISKPFQSQNNNQMERLKSLGFDVSPLNIHHTLISQIFLQFESPGLSLPSWLKVLLRDMMGGHHGRFSSPGDLIIAKSLLSRDEASDWRGMRNDTARIILGTMNYSLPQCMPAPKNLSAAIMLITGFTILSDWLGSDEKYFPPANQLGLDNYLPVCRQQARKVVEWAGFTSKTFSTISTKFESIFSQLKNPRPIQESINAIPAECFSAPILAIIEAPTGEGKTEAALALSHRIAAAVKTVFVFPTHVGMNRRYFWHSARFMTYSPRRWG
ncbi:MAG: CRISPR-associated endonuclease Cas3'' [Bellilinea sp.]